MNVARKVTVITTIAAGILALVLSPGLSAERPEPRADGLSECQRYARRMGEVYRMPAEAVSPAVVHIASSRPGGGLGTELFGRFFDIPRSTLALGSGVLVRPDGYILTNYHVIRESGKLTVKLQDGREFEAGVVGTDPPTDVAVIKIRAEDLPVAELGNSDETAVGHIVLAIGNPYGLVSTVTQGIISATGRANVGIADYEDFIQTDAAINPGNSGGPLIDIGGKVIGINTAILTRTGGFQGIGLAIPANMAGKVMQELIEEGHVTRGYLGITIQNITPELARALQLESNQGVVVTDVGSNTPAQRAGLREGDVIIEYEGRPVTDVRQLRSMVATTQIGKDVRIIIAREGTSKTLTARIGEQEAEQIGPPTRPAGSAVRRLGIEIRDLTEAARRQFGIRATKGVLIAGVVPDGPADKAAVKPGTVILEANHIRVRNVREFQQVLKKIPKGNNVMLLLEDRGMKYYVVVRPGR